jgi:hypothetical protein
MKIRHKTLILYCIFLATLALLASGIEPLRSYLSSIDKKDIFSTIDKYKYIVPEDREKILEVRSSLGLGEILIKNDVITDSTIICLDTRIDTLRIKRKQPVVNLDIYVKNCSDSTIQFYKAPRMYPVIYNTWKNAGKKTYKRLKKTEKEYYEKLHASWSLERKKEYENRWYTLRENLQIIEPNETVKVNVELDFRFPNGTSMILELTKREYYFSIFYECFAGSFTYLSIFNNVDINLENLYGGRTCSNLMKLIVED